MICASHVTVLFILQSAFYTLQMTVFLINKIGHIQQYLRLEKVTSVLGHDLDSQANTCVL